jgi:hypothetical protein
MLAAVFLLAGLLWAWRWSDQPAVSRAAGAASVVTLYCGACKAQTTMPGDQLAIIEFDASNALKCPACGKFAGQVFRRGGSMFPAGRTSPAGGG